LPELTFRARFSLRVFGAIHSALSQTLFRATPRHAPCLNLATRRGFAFVSTLAAGRIIAVLPLTMKAFMTKPASVIALMLAIATTAHAEYFTIPNGLVSPRIFELRISPGCTTRSFLLLKPMQRQKSARTIKLAFHGQK
jgi:hypothetical protein